MSFSARTEQLLNGLAAALEKYSPDAAGDIQPGDQRIDWIEPWLQSWPRSVELFQGVRLDVNDSAILQQQLEHMMAETFNIEYPALQSREFYDVDGAVNAGAEVVAYKQYDKTGTAKVIHGSASDIPLVNLKAKKFTQPLVSLAAGYELSFQDLRAAAMAGVPIDDEEAMAAREVIEIGIDDLAADGDSTVGIKGAISHASIGTTALAAAGTWSAKTADQIIADFAAGLGAVLANTKGKHRVTHVIVPLAQHVLLSTKKVGTDDGASVRRWLLDNIDGLVAISAWDKLNGAGAGGGDRARFYEKSRRTGRIVLPMEFMMHPAQPRGLAYLVPCEARCGGFLCPYPMAHTNMDGV